jgi:hypothetical protein
MSIVADRTAEPGLVGIEERGGEDPVQPDFEFPSPPELLKGEVSPSDGVLNQILGVGAASRHAECG